MFAYLIACLSLMASPAFFISAYLFLKLCPPPSVFQDLFEYWAWAQKESSHRLEVLNEGPWNGSTSYSLLNIYMVPLRGSLVSLLGFERWPFNTIDLRGPEVPDATLIPMDARQQMMWEVCFPRKRIQEKEISNFQ